MEQRSIRGINSKTTAALIVAAIGGMCGMFGGLTNRAARKPRKPVPMMVTSSREEIAAWNAKVDQRKAARWAVKLERRAIDAAMHA